MKQLFFIFALLSSLQVWAQDYTENNVNYYISGSEAYVGRSPSASGDVTILEKINVAGTEYPVTSFNRYGSFLNCKGLTSISIPGSISNIPPNAFTGCTGLMSVSLSLGVTSISGQAFYGCTNLSSINFPSSLLGIDVLAFYGSALTSITIPGNVERVDGFGGCTKLTSVTICEGVKELGGDAFSGCSELTSIIIPSSVNMIYNSSPFADCPKLESITVASGNTEYDSRDNCNAIIQKSSNMLISGCKNTVIPDGITSIFDCAFKGCTFTEITIPSSVTNIQYASFWGCTELTSITLPENVTSIEMAAFKDCSSLISVEIPNSLTHIGREAFAGTAWYEGQDDGILYLDNWLLGYKGDGPTGELIVKDGTKGIADNAFSDCRDLTSVTIPNSVTSIGYSAFSYCSGLTSVTVLREQPVSISQYTFSNRANATLYVPAGCKDAYEAADYWKEFKEIIEISASTSETIDISSAGIRTFTSSHALDFTGISGLQAYIISGFRPSTGALVLTQVNDVPAGEGLLLRGAAGEYEIPYTTTDMYYTNLLTGVTSTTEISPTAGDQTNFILADGIHGINFYTLSETGEIAAGKAYLHLPTSVLTSSAREGRFVFDFDGDNITGIDEHEADINTEKRYFDLQGRVVKKLRNGIYILNGKKIFIK